MCEDIYGWPELVRDPMNGSTNMGASPVVVALLLIVLIVAGGIIGYVFLVGAQQGFNVNSTGLTANITAALYSTDAKIGLYGGRSNFTISVGSSVSTPQIFDVNITSNSHEVQGNSYILLPNQVTTITLSQQLNQTGVWAVKVTTHGVTISVYYFQVVGTGDEAGFAVAQWRDQQYYRNLIMLSLIVALISFIISAASLARRPKTIIQAGT